MSTQAHDFAGQGTQRHFLLSHEPGHPVLNAAHVSAQHRVLKHHA
ncbi:MAG: hypothetical protein U1E02_24765 [Hydrogenophaga sp.]|nr:hypothetical protein [Hydrogenophaga sp.]